MGQAQHEKVTVNYTEPRWSEDAGDSASTTMYEAQFDARPPRRGQRWYQCPVCLETFPAGEVSWVHGKPYCPEDAADVLEDDWKAKHRRVTYTPETERAQRR